MDSEITNAAKTCKSCTSRLPSHPAEPLRRHEPAFKPFEHICADLGEDTGCHFLVFVDSFSGWLHVVMFNDKNTTAYCLINATGDFFTTMGVPVRL